MKKYLKNVIFGISIFLSINLLSGLNAVPRKVSNLKSYSTKSYRKKPYSKKSPYAGYGKLSKVNGLPKTKIIKGHVKRSTKGFTYINPYARSK